MVLWIIFVILHKCLVTKYRKELYVLCIINIYAIINIQHGCTYLCTCLNIFLGLLFSYQFKHVYLHLKTLVIPYFTKISLEVAYLQSYTCIFTILAKECTKTIHKICIWAILINLNSKYFKTLRIAMYRQNVKKELAFGQLFTICKKPRQNS